MKKKSVFIKYWKKSNASIICNSLKTPNSIFGEDFEQQVWPTKKEN